MQCFFDINLFFFGNKFLRYLKSNYKAFMTIILIGYMGSGKSTIGQKLSEILKFDFLDLDMYIQNKEGKSIPELFVSKGEIYFRKIESHYLGAVIAKEHMVVSLGGGTPCYGNNMTAINNLANVKSIYLKASIPDLVERLFNERAERPLISHLKNKDELTEFIGKHLFERSFFYSQADITISVDGKPVDEIIADIVTKLF
jgi:shikimate kinase